MASLTAILCEIKNSVLLSFQENRATLDPPETPIALEEEEPILIEDSIALDDSSISVSDSAKSRSDDQAIALEKTLLAADIDVIEIVDPKPQTTDSPMDISSNLIGNLLG